MNIRYVLVAVLALAVGALLGRVTDKSYLKGRLSACQDIVGVLNTSLPLQLECVVVENDVYLTTPFQPGAKISLDGKRNLGER